jgi:hypothetical protein
MVVLVAAPVVAPVAGLLFQAKEMSADHLGLLAFSWVALVAAVLVLLVSLTCLVVLKMVERAA